MSRDEGGEHPLPARSVLTRSTTDCLSLERPMETVYLETTFVSYLVARPSRDVIVAAHQQTTYDWWDTRRDSFDCYVSQVVIDEASAGDPSEIRKRLQIIQNFAVLEATSLRKLWLARFSIRAFSHLAPPEMPLISASPLFMGWII